MAQDTFEIMIKTKVTNCYNEKYNELERTIEIKIKEAEESWIREPCETKE